MIEQLKNYRGPLFLSLLVLGNILMGLNIALRRRLDVLVFKRAAERLWQGQWITIDENFHFTYPPFFAVLMLPSILFSEEGFRIVWWLLNSSLLLFCLYGCAQLSRHYSPKPETSYQLGLALLLSYQGVLAVFQTQQFDLLVFSMIIAGLLFLQKNRSLPAGIFLGLAAAVKVVPAFFLVVLLFVRKFRAAAAMAVVGLLSLILTDVFFLAPQEGYYLSDWLAKIVNPHPSLIAVAEQPFTGFLAPGGGDNPLNQSFMALFYRLFAVHSQSYLNLVHLPSGIQSLLKLSLVVLFLFVFYRGPVRNYLSDEASLGLLASHALVLMLLISPMSSKPHFVSLLLPLSCLLAVLGTTLSHKQKLGLAGLFFFGVLSGRDVIGSSAAEGLYQLSILGLVAGAISLWLWKASSKCA